MARFAVLFICMTAPLVQGMEKVDAKLIEQKWGWDWFNDQIESASSAISDVSQQASDAVSSAVGGFNATSILGNAQDTLSDFGDTMDKLKDQAISGLSSTFGLCDSLKEALGNSTEAIKKDITDQNLHPIDYTSEEDNDCIAKVTEDIETEVTKALESVGLVNNDVLKSSIAWIAEKSASASCSTQDALDDIDLWGPLDSLCPDNSRLFTVFGHPLFEKNGAPAAALIIPSLLMAAAGMGLVYRRRQRQGELLLQADEEQVLE
eukprot:CAMPEP_0197650096 /NCGR_PEP_ID=MMETSP1338-20131121/30741_1 /TAXON_ID=43686 ORGANISM="Pelagodinium beii, Strain RCC1491" /NCGR_SAMPLE_ID=MMETSP1338 /ASSEMBLY_ACC=CAM_ASM_000754 /LENGTH=262 /DNA_ID=CAMNT_0043224445 /DNA_START=56 /DNA_END=844 /DNA_ORIENTATION=+